MCSKLKRHKFFLIFSLIYTLPHTIQTMILPHIYFYIDTPQLYVFYDLTSTLPLLHIYRQTYPEGGFCDSSSFCPWMWRRSLGWQVERRYWLLTTSRHETMTRHYQSSELCVRMKWNGGVLLGGRLKEDIGHWLLTTSRHGTMT